MQTLVAYDIGDDRLRLLAERSCRDAGMIRAQFSAFLGDLSPEQRDALRRTLERIVREHGEREKEEQRKQRLFIQIFPICAADFAASWTIDRQGGGPAQPDMDPEVMVL